MATRSHHNSNPDVQRLRDKEVSQQKKSESKMAVGTHVGTISIEDANEVLTALIVAVSSVSLPSVYPIGSSFSKALTLSESLKGGRGKGK